MKRQHRLPRCRFRSRWLDSSRRGLVVASVILCLLVVSAMILNLVQTTTVLLRQSVHYSHRLQLQVLTDDALSHALHQYRHSENYNAETWDISPDQWALHQSGQVKIRVDQQSDGKTILTVQGFLMRDQQVLQKMTKTIILK